MPRLGRCFFVMSHIEDYVNNLSAIVLALLGVCCGFGCASSPSVIVKDLPSAVLDRRLERIDPALMVPITGAQDNDPYQVGPGDSVLVAVYGHPELSIATYAGTALTLQTSRLAGLVVDNDGTIQFPLIGSVKVAGKSCDELRIYLEKELATYINEPKVTVQVVVTRSLRYSLVGQFAEPGLKFNDRPVRLLEALALGGTIALDKASLRSAYIARKGKRLPIDFRRLIVDGDLSQNIPLRSGDVIVVPDRSSDQAYVFGASATSTQRGGVVPFVNGRLSLLQALAQAGFGFRDFAQGSLSNTHIIRSYGDRGELYIVDAQRILNGEAAPFELAPGDVVYVPATGLTTWNEIISTILPSLQTVAGVLTPFVDIKYLSH